MLKQFIEIGQYLRYLEFLPSLQNKYRPNPVPIIYLLFLYFKDMYISSYLPFYFCILGIGYSTWLVLRI